jgi:hypothetical protein
MPSRKTRAAAIAVALPLSVAALTGCGSGNNSTTATDTQNSPTSSPTASAGQTISPAAFLHNVKSAAKTLTTAHFHMHMDESGQVVDATGAMDVTGHQPAMQVKMNLPGTGTATQMRLVDGAMYIQEPGTTKFVKFDLNDPNSPLGNVGNLLDNFNPSSMVDKIPAHLFKKVTYLGTDTVAGEQAKHYRVTFDLGAATKMFGGNLPSSSGDTHKSLSYDVWLDDQGRQVKFTMKLPNVVQMTSTYSKFGEPVHISPPDKSQIESLPSSSTSG